MVRKFVLTLSAFDFVWSPAIALSNADLGNWIHVWLEINVGRIVHASYLAPEACVSKTPVIIVFSTE